MAGRAAPESSWAGVAVTANRTTWSATRSSGPRAQGEETTGAAGCGSTPGRSRSIRTGCGWVSPARSKVNRKVRAVSGATRLRTCRPRTATSRSSPPAETASVLRADRLPASVLNESRVRVAAAGRVSVSVGAASCAVASQAVAGSPSNAAPARAAGWSTAALLPLAR